jgi:hypothetical protein
MPRGTRKLQINRQQKNILLLALFLLKHAHGKAQPLKRHVIAFIDTKNLIIVRPEDRRTVATGEEAWENSIAFRRADLKAEGCLTMPDIGFGRLRQRGRGGLSSGARS